MRISKVFLYSVVFVIGFTFGYYGAVYSVNEMRMQECLIIESKLQQYVFLHADLSVPLKQRRAVHFPEDLDALGPVYGRIFGISYEIDKDKFLYEPSIDRTRYSLEVGLSYGKKYISPRSL